MSHRGGKEEKIAAQIPMGQITYKLLDLIDINKYIIDSVEKISEIPNIVKNSQLNKTSVAIILTPSLWRNSK